MKTTMDKITPGLSKKLNLLADCVALGFAIGVASGHSEGSLSWVTPIAMVGLSAWVLVATSLRLYSPTGPRRKIDTATLTVIVVGATTLALAVVRAALGSGGPAHFDLVRFGQLMLLSSWGSSILCSFLTKMDHVEEPLLIVGTGPLALATYEWLTHAKQTNRTIVGFLSFPGQPTSLRGIPEPVLGCHTEVEDLLSHTVVGEVYVAGRVTAQAAQMQAVVNCCEELGLPFALPLHTLRFNRAQILSNSAATDGYLHYLGTRTRPLQYAVKRLADIVLSFTALVILSPLLFGVGLGIKLGSRGPIFFKQVRVGLHGSLFNLYKFRSMVVNADKLKATLAAQNEQSGPVFKMKADPRVTGIGHFIRKYSIDELPQLLNILRGDMTIVGPRPALPIEVAEYKAWQRRRLSVRPGLTCYWQVGGRNEIGFDEWMHLDLEYVDNWSLRLDVRLILKTFPVVLMGRGAS